jgi:tetratricopeptide (TPR) repeat protein
MKYLAFEASVYLGEALVESKDYEHARQELERVLPGAEKLELRAVLAQAHYSLATALRLSGHGAEATAHYRQALQYLDEIRKDTGSDAFLQRSDLKPISVESTRWSQLNAK